ncbi:ecotin [Pseudopedobacter beijingensis]|uniref:Ecotin n=1 Tax=Pseudopedobacter beijingensis TaxID=1207056 RepID=A0ABW4IGH5_9SPHI
MNRNTLKAIILLMTIMSMKTFAQSNYKVDLSPFPKPEKGQKQFVIEVPHSDNDDIKKIEFYVGKWEKTDKCNKHFLGGTFDKKDLKGWGYDYYVFNTKGNVGSTLMACLDNAKVDSFVQSQPIVTNYNGRMPIVIYVPEGYEVKFKIYTASQEVYSASEIQQKNK